MRERSNSQSMTSSHSASSLSPSVVRLVLRTSFILGTAGLFLAFDHRLLAPDLSPAIAIAVFLWLFAAVVMGALTVERMRTSSPPSLASHTAHSS
jgi:hypothetical protein